MRIIMAALAVLIFHTEVSFANTCTEKQLKNCVGVDAKKRFLKWTPVCVMDVECDVYCGSLKLDRQQTTFYCGFRSVRGNEFTCMSPIECGNDDSVVKTQSDVDQLTRNPISPGTGLKPLRDSSGSAQ